MIEKCCDELPEYKEKDKKNRYTYECPSCGLIIGAYHDRYAAELSWNEYHRNKKYIETYKKINDKYIFIPLEVKR